jgi:hypothetical protein
MKCGMARRSVLVACAALALAACADGYPTEDGALRLKFGMSKEATLTAMNTIGHHGYLEHRWRYEVDEACVLRVRSRALGGGEAAVSATTPGLHARVVVTGGDHSRLVFAHPPGSSGTQGGTLVLGGANEFDAGQMKWLVDYLGTICRAAPAPTR